MHMLLDNFHQGVRYYDQIASRQEELRREEMFVVKNNYLCL